MIYLERKEFSKRHGLSRDVYKFQFCRIITWGSRLPVSQALRTDLIYATSEDKIHLFECLIKGDFVCWVRVRLATSAISGIM
jgi:hypothetical protein